VCGVHQRPLPDVAAAGHALRRAAYTLVVCGVVWSLFWLWDGACGLGVANPNRVFGHGHLQAAGGAP
jgi:hypothetical protein